MLWGKISITSEAAVGMRAGAESLESWRGERGCWGAAENCSLEKATGTPRKLPCVKLSQRAQPDHGVQEQKLLVMSPVAGSI